MNRLAHRPWELVCRDESELLMNKLVVSRNAKERVLIESSINSMRISIKIKQSDDIEQILCKKFSRFMTQRAEQFFIMRRKAIEVRTLSSLSFSLLVTT